MLKTRIEFSKSGVLRYIGHLDFLRVFGQMLRRSGLPVGFSQGFNPHILLGFALPLPLGMASERDYADLVLNKQICLTDAARLLQACAPQGLTIHRVSEYKGRGAAAVTAAADYEIPLSAQDAITAQKNTAALLAAPEWIISKKTKSGMKDTNIRGDIFQISITDKHLTMRLAAGSGRYLNPVSAAEIILAHTVSAGEITRTQLYACVGEGFIPLSEIK